VLKKAVAQMSAGARSEYRWLLIEFREGWNAPPVDSLKLI